MSPQPELQGAEKLAAAIHDALKARVSRGFGRGLESPWGLADYRHRDALIAAAEELLDREVILIGGPK
jgi:hypothetical protein